MLRVTTITGGCCTVQANSPPDGRINFRLNPEDHPELAQALAAAAATGRRGAITRRIIELAEKGLLYELQAKHQSVPQALPTASSPKVSEPVKPSGPGDLGQKEKALADEFD